MIRTSLQNLHVMMVPTHWRPSLVTFYWHLTLGLPRLHSLQPLAPSMLQVSGIPVLQSPSDGQVADFGLQHGGIQTELTFWPHD